MYTIFSAYVVGPGECHKLCYLTTSQCARHLIETTTIKKEDVTFTRLILSLQQKPSGNHHKISNRQVQNHSCINLRFLFNNVNVSTCGWSLIGILEVQTRGTAVSFILVSVCFNQPMVEKILTNYDRQRVIITSCSYPADTY